MKKLRIGYNSNTKEVPLIISVSSSQSLLSRSSKKKQEQKQKQKLQQVSNNAIIVIEDDRDGSEAYWGRRRANSDASSRMTQRDDASSSSMFRDILSEDDEDDDYETDASYGSTIIDDSTTTMPETPTGESTPTSSMLLPPPQIIRRHTVEDGFTFVSNVKSFDEGDDIFFPEIESSPSETTENIPYFPFEEDYVTMTTVSSFISDEEAAGIFRNPSDNEEESIERPVDKVIARAAEVSDDDDDAPMEACSITMEEMQAKYFEPSMIISTSNSPQFLIVPRFKCCDLSDSELEELHILRQHAIIDIMEDDDEDEESVISDLPKFVATTTTSTAGAPISRTEQLLQEQEAYREALMHVDEVIRSMEGVQVETQQDESTLQQTKQSLYAGKIYMEAASKLYQNAIETETSVSDQRIHCGILSLRF
eukprot:CAMPEP_0118713778 /NCGR_PEP_ID=MMETSP0800-20121206/25740_1 /TAXON_ID=210618 ORGANISM="Striatella unipunctata, Strain CCMP2910" /NCGR_SAMPLE_ID=MMETSP0800 /ASSEMBLY_ACC=CAM_ASM_000638 /LENGTH=422 /DNA_ID=CAMNT_0006619337 /DNA_START=125 /DNA_END=1393 /DNA_ORIENTATION=+